MERNKEFWRMLILLQFVQDEPGTSATPENKEAIRLLRPYHKTLEILLKMASNETTCFIIIKIVVTTEYFSTVK